MPQAGDPGDLDRLIARVDPDRWLASRFIADPAARADVVALYAFDHELWRARARASNPLIAEIRLTWWREALDEIFEGRPVRRHPTAQALERALQRRSLPRAPLEEMIDGHIDALEPPVLDEAQALAFADAGEGALAKLAAQALDPSSPAEAAAPAGRAWGLALLTRTGRAPADVVAAALRGALAQARTQSRRLGARAFPAVLAAALLRSDLSRRELGPLAKRLRLLAAAATGRI